MTKSSIKLWSIESPMRCRRIKRSMPLRGASVRFTRVREMSSSSGRGRRHTLGTTKQSRRRSTVVEPGSPSSISFPAGCVDHNLLRASLAVRVRRDTHVLDLLCKCLGVWTTNASGNHVRHGVPQGPEASAFLAEVCSWQNSTTCHSRIHYLRYVDDIRLLAKDEVPIRQSMLRLDLLSKDLGLVPQALKIGVKQYKSVQEILKTGALVRCGRLVPESGNVS